MAYAKLLSSTAALAACLLGPGALAAPAQLEWTAPAPAATAGNEARATLPGNEGGYRAQAVIGDPTLLPYGSPASQPASEPAEPVSLPLAAAAGVALLVAQLRRRKNVRLP